MERIKKKMVDATPTSTAINRMIVLYKEYERCCERQPKKLDKWTTWFLTESYVVLKDYEIIP